MDDPEDIKEEIEHQKALIKRYTKRLRVLEEQAAEFGKLYTPAHIVNEISDLKGLIETGKTHIKQLEQTLHPATTQKPAADSSTEKLKKILNAPSPTIA